MGWGCSRGTAVGVLAGALAMSACSSGPSGHPADGGAPPDTGVVGCKGSQLAQTYAAPMVERGSSGKYTFRLEAASPAPPALLSNTWTVKIADAAGNAPGASAITVTPRMPLMNHGSDQTPVVRSKGDGTFEVSNIYLFMPGLWAVTFDVVGGEAVLDSAAFTFCIE